MKKQKEKVNTLLDDLEENFAQRRILLRYLCYYTQGIFMESSIMTESKACSGYVLYLENMTGAQEVEKAVMRDFVYENIIKILQ